ncbi:hypothetical protein GDO86_016073 [Hymenochirus boettgeri]|uniref:HPS5-like beta-propeller domain-containing protein n=1 Tax=Hymenochirus boettgeri TaxID=247094 RepID=A0A8T2K3P4_9PIPI|nr:hypothetical protein GDO86_016073 [Hymenochirus boettgeri]
MATGVQRVGQFKEFCPLYSILNAIPAKVQKGFRSILVYLTALDVNSDFIAVGSSIGMLYLYCRHTNQMKKYNLEGKTESISAVKLLNCFDDLVAVGTVSGRVAVFQLVSPLPGRNKQLRRFDVLGIHKSSITALAWSPNGMKLFSGDIRGKIIRSDLDFDKGSCNPSLVLEELSSIVQLDYSQKVLLVSTTQRCLLFYTDEKAVKQVGTQPRKSNGKYGACFVPGLCKQSDLKAFASRPGLRLWKTDVHGCVLSTFILKDLLPTGLESFELYPRVETNKNNFALTEKHFGLLSCFLHEGWVLSWDEYSIYLIDTINQAVVGGLESAGDIVAVSCTNNEIFLIKGDREIIRISDMPEGSSSAETVHSPFRIYTPQCATENTHLAGALSSCVIQNYTKSHLKTDTIQLWSLEDEEIAVDLEDKSRERSCSLPTEEIKSRSSSLNSIDSGFSLTAAGDPLSPNNGHRPSCQRFSTISNEDFEQELVVKPIKVKKKKKKRNENGLKNQDTFSLESTPSADSSLTLNSDFFPNTESLTISSLDHISSQESLYNGKYQSVLEENIDIFSSAVERSKAIPSVLDNKIIHPDDLVNVSSNHDTEPLDAVECNPVSSLNFRKPNGELYELLLKQDAEFLPGKVLDYTESYILDNCENPFDLSNMHFNINVLKEANSFDIQKDEHLGDEQFETTNRMCHVSSSFFESCAEHTISQVPKDSSEEFRVEKPDQDCTLASSDEDDIYGHRFPHSNSESSVADASEMVSYQDMTYSTQEESGLLKSDQLSESWMVYSGPANGILSLVVSEKYLWCLDYKGSLSCSALPGAGLRWQKFEEVSNRCSSLLWKIEQKSGKAFACGKVTIKGKRHWYEALPQATFVALSDDTAWIIRPNGDLYLQTGLSVDRPCARAVKVDCPCPLSQITARNNVVWALTEQRGLLYREGVSSFSPEGEVWKCDLVSESQAMEPACVALGDQDTVWILDARGNLWFRSGVTAKNPQGEDDHWGTASTTKWSTVSASAFPTAEGNILWISQSRKDLFCLSDLNPPYRPSTIQLPPETEIIHLSACSDAVWALDTEGGVFIRTLSKSCPTGMHWTKLDLSQLGLVKLCSLSCGNQNIWACDTSGVIYFRVGTQPLNPSMMLPAWIIIESPIQPIGIGLIGVYSSPNDKMLWALDNRWNVYVRVGIIEEMPVGTEWEHVPGLQACQLTVSTRTVWARCLNGDIARRYGITEKNAAGDYWKKIPGNISWLTVTPTDELWAVGNTGYLLQRLTKTYSHYPNIPKHDSVLISSDFEDEWEVI